MAVKLEIHELGEHAACATVGCVILRIIDGALTEVDTIDRFMTHAEAVLARAHFTGLWIVVNHGSPPPTLGVARHAARRLNAHGERQTTVYSMLGIGFWVAAARRTTVILNKLLRSPSFIEDTVEAGARRLAMELVGVNSDELIEAHDRLRAKMLALQRGELPSEESAEEPSALRAGPASADASASTSRVGERSMIRRFRIVADEELCHGHGMCAAEAPELFRVVDDKVQIEDPEPNPKLWFKAEAASRYCPQFALTIEELED